MKCNVGFSVTRSNEIDLDKHLLILSNENKNLNISKELICERFDCLLIKDLIKGITISEIKGEKCSIEMKVDTYILADCGYTLVNMQFEIPDHLVNDFNIPDMMLFTKLLYENNENTVFALIFPYLLKNIILDDKIGEIKHKMIDSDISIYDQKEIYYNKTGCKYFFNADELALGFSASPAYLFFHDYENKIDIDNWDVFDYKNITFSNEITGASIIKDSKYADDFFNFIVLRNIRTRLVEQMNSLCRSWLYNLQNKSEDISKNIANDNSNQYYWKELKKIIELIDLNFLPIQTFIAQECSKNELNTGLLLRLTEEYKEKYRQRRNNQVQELLMLLNEVKYSINNISTPGHSYNDYMLQAETEKVNERIMLISFIAMAIPCIYALSSQTISLFVKLFSALGIITIPLFYFLINAIKKKIALRRNFKMEKRRLFNQSTKELKELKMEMEGKVPKILPKDLVDKIVAMMKSDIEIKEKEIEKLKGQI